MKKFNNKTSKKYKINIKKTSKNKLKTNRLKIVKGGGNTQPKGLPTEFNFKNIVDDFVDKEQNLLITFKDAYNNILGKLGGDIKWKISKKNKEKLKLSKLDILKFIKNTKSDIEKYPPPLIKKILETYDHDIENGNNLDIIDNIISLNCPSFFQTFISGAGQFAYEGENKYKNFINSYEFETLEFGIYVSIQMSEIIKNLNNIYEIEYIDCFTKMSGKITINSLEEIDDKKLDELIRKTITNVLIYIYAFPELKDKQKLPNVRLHLNKALKELPPKGNLESIKQFIPKINERFEGSISNMVLFTGNYINSGLTDNAIQNTILLFREEEWPKVLLHECLHYFNIIKCQDTAILINYAIESLLGHAIFETIIETLADIFNTIILSSTTDELKMNLIREITFIYEQAGKILNYAGYRNWNEYYKPNNTDADKHIIETTNMHAYFILRTLIFRNLNKFFDLIKVQVPKKKNNNTGATGASGSQGNTGASGSQGNTGASGSQGNNNKNPEFIIDSDCCKKVINILDEVAIDASYVTKINEYIAKPITNNSLRMTSLE